MSDLKNDFKSMKTWLFILFLFVTSVSQGGVVELMSEGTHYLVNSASGGEACGSYDSQRVNDLLAPTSLYCAPAQTGKNSFAFLRRSAWTVKEKLLFDSEDYLFEKLAVQHSKELSCAKDFAQSIAGQAKAAPKEALSNLEDKFKTLRLARQVAIKLTDELNKSPFPSKVCPAMLSDLEPNPIMMANTGVDAHYELCKKIIIARTAYHTTLSSLPLLETAAVRDLADAYANEKQKRGVHAQDLQARIKKAYKSAAKELNDESVRLLQVAKEKGGQGFDRQARYSLMSDPRVVKQVIGEDKDLVALACIADGRYYSGARELGTGVNVALLAATFVSGPGLKVLQGLGRARSAGAISLSSSRLLQQSLLVLGVNGGALASTVINDCNRGEKLRMNAAGSCVAAPRVEQLAQDTCALNLALNGMGFLTAAGQVFKEAKSILKVNAAISGLASARAMRSAATIKRVDPGTYKRYAEELKTLRAANPDNRDPYYLAKLSTLKEKAGHALISESFSNSAKNLNEAIFIRPINSSSLRQLEGRVSTKPMGVGSRTSREGVAAGFIVRDGSPEIEALIKEGSYRVKPLVTSRGTAVRQGDKEFWTNNVEGTQKPIEVLHDMDGNPIVSDVDVLLFARKSKDGNGAIKDSSLGFVSPADKKSIETINENFSSLDRHTEGRVLVQHGPENMLPGSDRIDYPLTVFFPDGKVTRILAGSAADPHANFRKVIAEMKAQGFNMDVPTTWNLNPL